MVIVLDEKRNFPRIKLHTPLRYQTRGGGEPNNSLSENISIGGISFMTDNFIAPNTCLMLEISILSKFINTVGKITWSAPLPHSDRYILGVRFIEIDSKDKKYLADCIDVQLGKI